MVDGITLAEQLLRILGRQDQNTRPVVATYRPRVFKGLDIDPPASGFIASTVFWGPTETGKDRPILTFFVGTDKVGAWAVLILSVFQKSSVVERGLTTTTLLMPTPESSLV